MGEKREKKKKIYGHSKITETKKSIISLFPN